MIQCGILDEMEAEAPPADEPWFPEHTSPEDLTLFGQAHEAAIRVGFWFVHTCVRCGRGFENDEPPTH